jgi:diaminopimelate decarboxylase
VSESPIPFDLLPESAAVSDGDLSIGGCSVVDLVAEHGSPLFIYDEQQLIDRCDEAVSAFGPGVAYASKAFLCKAMARIAHESGMHIDVSTGGEMYIALKAGVPAGKLVLHGNNKSAQELQMALEAGVGRIVVDSFDELDRIEELVATSCDVPQVLIRVNPGIEAHTHEYLQTGITDSKFGFPVAQGIARSAIERAVASGAMTFRGIHAHIGSQVFDVDSYRKAIVSLAPFVVESGAEELSIGGGLGVAYVEGEIARSLTEWAEIVRDAVSAAGITASVSAEPGRSIVARAAVTAYTVGTIKSVPDVRTYVAVDGGLSDNPRPGLYGSGYEAFLPRAVAAPRTMRARIVGKHCESGDILVREADLPADLSIGDIVCTPVTGAYGHSMGSNYNQMLRPAVVFVRDGASRVVVARDTYDDLIANDVG